MQTIRTPKKRKAVLEALATGVSISAACKCAGIGRASAYEWRRDDAEFAAEWESAVDTGTDKLEDIAFERAQDSSDTLLIFLLKARRPNKYHERMALAHMGKDGGPIETKELSDLECTRRMAFLVTSVDPAPPTTHLLMLDHHFAWLKANAPLLRTCWLS
jgi:hypothetical protein